MVNTKSNKFRSLSDNWCNFLSCLCHFCGQWDCSRSTWIGSKVLLFMWNNNTIQFMWISLSNFSEQWNCPLSKWIGSIVRLFMCWAAELQPGGTFRGSRAFLDPKRPMGTTGLNYFFPALLFFASLSVFFLILLTHSFLPFFPFLGSHDLMLSSFLKLHFWFFF